MSYDINVELKYMNIILEIRFDQSDLLNTVNYKFPSKYFEVDMKYY